MQSVDDLLVFVQVVENASFSKAAKQLGRSKAAVSKQVSRLENRLGVRLLNRTTRRLSLTEAGVALHERGTRIAAEVEAAETAVTRLQREPRGTLRVSAPMSFGVLHLAPTLAAFLVRHPQMTVDLSLSDRFVDLIEEGFDIAIRIGDLADTSLIARQLAPNRRLVCASPDYIAARGMPRTPADLIAHNCLCYSYLASQDEWRFTGPQGPVAVKVHGNLRANNGDALRAAMLDGLGIGLAPTFIVGEDVKARRLTVLLAEYRSTESSVYAVWPHSRHLSAKVRVFVDHLAARFGDRPYWDEACGAA
jgi:DNA-binding transcriptional LysR family regulator